MESLAVFVDEEWDSLSRMFSSEEEYSDHQHFGLQLHGTGIFSGECGDHDTMINIETPSSFWPSTDESSNANAPIFEEGVFLDYYFSQENSTNSSDTSSNTNLSRPTPTHGDGNYHHADSNLLTHHLMPTHNFSDRSMQFYTMDDSDNNMLGQVFSDDVMEEILCLKQAANVEMTKMEHSDSQQVAIADPDREMQLKRKFEMSETPEATKDDVVKIDPVDKNPKKKQRVPKDNKTKKNAQSKKNQKVIASETDGHDGESETNNGGGNGQSSSSFSSEDDSNSNSNASQESNGGALNLNGKTRAGRGAATDPQSLYARKRRERINERLRILQNLVPNGTKVDISTMLEEAVHYVKFLKLQIKLLSSDDMWMYAPIAYNGMDMGLYQKINSSTQ